jgi:malonyl-CoA O-methyltransferase
MRRTMRFDERASDYARHARPQAEVARRLAERIPHADTMVEALELGAGTGLLTRELVRLGYTVRATDISPAMLAAGARAEPGATWEPLDAWNPPPACCDQIFSSSLLQWCPDPVTVFRRYHEALRPGGKMTHAVFTEGTLRELHAVSDAPAPVPWRDADAWFDAARAAGFRILSGQSVTLRLHYPNGAALLREIHGTGAVSGKPMLSPGALRQVLREYDRRFVAPEGGVTATWSALLFSAARD